METTFNKVALVTGGSSGIGSHSNCFAKRSQSSRGRLEENDEMVDLIKELGSEAIFYQMRCLKTDDVKRWWRKQLPHLAD
jgi:NADP-dependent 3-hydroxy acid dehydrogenase YdfG